MQKAAEDLRNEAKAKAEEKERYINERVGPLSLEGKAEGTLLCCMTLISLSFYKLLYFIPTFALFTEAV